MSENVDNIVLEQLRLIRDDMRLLRDDIVRVETALGDKIDTVEAKLDGLTGVVIGLGKYVHDLDGRVEHLEDRMGD